MKYEMCRFLRGLDGIGLKIGFLESVLKSINRAVYNYLNIKLSKITKKFFLQLFKNFLYFFNSKYSLVEK